MYSRSRCSLLFCLLLSTLWSHGIGKTTRAPAPPTLAQLTQKAAYIFSGTVLSVERVQPRTQNEVPTVRITFRVNQAVRGVSARQTLVIREWAGLWEFGDRYRPGEQVMLFLYQTSRLGLTSPVNGSFGRFKLDNSGKIPLAAGRLSALDTPLPTTVLRGKISINSRDLVRAIRRLGD